MNRLLLFVSALCLVFTADSSRLLAVEILHLSFENGADLAEDSSGAGQVTGAVTPINFFGSLTQSSDTPTGGGSNSANFVPFIDPNSDNGAVNIEFTGAGMPDFSNDDSFTFSLWLKPTATYVADGQGFRGVASGLASGTSEWQIDNGATFDPNDPNAAPTNARINATNSPNVDLISGGNLDPNQWTQVAVTYIGTSKSAIVSIGDESNDLSFSSVSSGGAGLAIEDLLIGSNRNRALFYEGLMDDVRLFDTAILYDGAGGEFEFGDLNFSGGSIDPNDWVDFRANMGADLSAETPMDAYAKGDIDFDGDNDFDDFVAFKSFYNEVNGLGAFEAIVSIPEPGSMALACSALLGAFGLSGRCRRRTLPVKRTPTVARSSRKAHSSMKYSCVVLSLALTFLLAVSSNLSAQTVVSTIANSTTIDLSGVNDGGTYETTITNRSTDPNTGNHLTGAFTRTYSITEGLVSFDYDLTWTGGGGNLHNFNGPTFSYGIDNGGGTDNNALDNTGPNPESITFAVSNIQQTSGPTSPITFDGFTQLGVFFTAQVSDAGGITDGTSDIWSFDGELGTNPADGNPATPSGVKVTGNSTDDSLYEWFGIRQHVHAQVDVSGTLPQTMVYEVRNNTNTSDNNRVRLNAVGVQFSIDIAPFVPLTLGVASNGDMSLTNVNDFGLEIDYIEIKSPDVELNGGSLDPNSFTGIGGDPNFPLGDGSGNGWELSGSNSDKSLVEAFLTGSSVIDPNVTIDLGTGFLSGGTQDLEFKYRVVGETDLRVGLVEYEGLAGDLNGDGVVDGIDFLGWQRGETVPPLSPAALAEWEGSYGSSTSSAITAVPEPNSALLCLAISSSLLASRSRFLLAR